MQLFILCKTSFFTSYIVEKICLIVSHSVTCHISYHMETRTLGSLSANFLSSTSARLFRPVRWSLPGLRSIQLQFPWSGDSPGARPVQPRSQPSIRAPGSGPCGRGEHPGPQLRLHQWRAIFGALRSAAGVRSNLDVVAAEVHLELTPSNLSLLSRPEAVFLLQLGPEAGLLLLRSGSRCHPSTPAREMWVLKITGGSSPPSCSDRKRDCFPGLVCYSVQRPVFELCRPGKKRKCWNPSNTCFFYFLTDTILHVH